MPRQLRVGISCAPRLLQELVTSAVGHLDAVQIIDCTMEIADVVLMSSDVWDVQPSRVPLLGRDTIIVDLDCGIVRVGSRVLPFTFQDSSGAFDLLRRWSKEGSWKAVREPLDSAD
jgi:hypothetical protein